MPSCSHHWADITWLYRYAGSSQVRPKSPTVGTSATRAVAKMASVASLNPLAGCARPATVSPCRRSRMSGSSPVGAGRGTDRPSSRLRRRPRWTSILSGSDVIGRPGLGFVHARQSWKESDPPLFAPLSGRIRPASKRR